MLFIDGRRCGNESREVNDYRDQRGNEVAGREVNAEYHEVLLDGWPRLFIKAIKDIPANTEILVSYGESYWESELLKCIPRA